MMYYIRIGNLGNKEVMNTLFLAGLSIGFGIMVWGYGFELYTRYFCPKEVCYIKHVTNILQYINFFSQHLPMECGLDFSNVGDNIVYKKSLFFF